MNKEYFVESFLKAVVEQDKQSLPSFFNDDAVVLWHCTNEWFTVNEYSRANCEYPGAWDGQLQRMDKLDKDKVIAVSKVYTKELPRAEFLVVSYITFEKDKIQKLEEYWADIGPAPQWRKDLHISAEIKK